jgi:hypothetical protein
MAINLHELYVSDCLHPTPLDGGRQFPVFPNRVGSVWVAFVVTESGQEESSGTPTRHSMNPQKGRTAMMPGLFSREAFVAEQRRQELLDEAAITRLIRNAQAVDPQPSKNSPRFNVKSAIDKVLKVVAHASGQPMRPGPRGFLDGLL